MSTFLQHYGGAFAARSPHLRRFREKPPLTRAGLAVASSSLVYAAFSLWLFAAGHQPSFTGNFIPPAQYYLWQGILLPAWLMVCWAVFSGAAHLLARVAGSTTSWRATASALGFALAIPLTSDKTDREKNDRDCSTPGSAIDLGGFPSERQRSIALSSVAAQGIERESTKRALERMICESVWAMGMASTRCWVPFSRS